MTHTLYTHTHTLSLSLFLPLSLVSSSSCAQCTLSFPSVSYLLRPLLLNRPLLLYQGRDHGICFPFPYNRDSLCVYIVCMCLGARAVCGCAYSTSVRDLRYLVEGKHQQGVHDFDTLSVRLQDAASLTEESFRSRTGCWHGQRSKPLFVPTCSAIPTLPPLLCRVLHFPYPATTVTPRDRRLSCS